MAEAVLIAARGDRRRVLVTAHAALGDLVARTDEVIGSDVTTRIRDLQAEGEGVLLISAGDDAALDAADVGVGYLQSGPEGGACWTADIICGPGLTEVWRLLRAAGAARSVSQRSVTIAASGATLGLLVATVGRVGRGRQGISLPVSPVQAASTASLLQGAYAARRLGVTAPPTPVPRIAWRSMPPMRFSANWPLSTPRTRRRTRPAGTSRRCGRRDGGEAAGQPRGPCRAQRGRGSGPGGVR